jgi:hypothetical protein
MRELADSRAMNQHIEVAENALRAVLVEEFRKEAKADAQSLDRMLAHLVNMNQSVATSPESHPNVKKRLGDFAATAARMANRNPDAGPQLADVAEKLRTASERIGS